MGSRCFKSILSSTTSFPKITLTSSRNAFWDHPAAPLLTHILRPVSLLRMSAIPLEPLRGTGRLLGGRSNTHSPHMCSFMSLASVAQQTFEPASMRAARRVGWNSLAFRLDRSTGDDEHSPLTSSRTS